MPREVKAWACSYGCGRKVSTKRQIIEKHEQPCFSNPARRACKTCKHDHKGVIDHEDNDCYCALDFGKPEGESLRDYGAGTTITCRADCPAWEAR